jgi:hypothetical protein
LIEQWLEEMEIPAIQKGQSHWGLSQSLGRVEPAEAAAENKHSMGGFH